MSKPDKPIAPTPAKRSTTLLWSVKLREPITLLGTSVVDEICPLDPARAGWEVAIVGPSVILASPPGSPAARGTLQTATGPTAAYADIAAAHAIEEPKDVRVAFEVPRAACVIRWLVPSDLAIEDIAAAVAPKQGQVTVCPDPLVRQLRGARAEAERDRPARSKRPAAEYLDPFPVGSGPAGEVA